MNKLEQAARQALEALEALKHEGNLRCMDDLAALATLREALAKQAEQEPVALIEECRDALAQELMAYDIDPPIHHVKQAHDKCVAWLSNYASPVRTKDLTDDEIEWLVVDTLETWNSKDTMKDFARAVIEKFKEKNK